MADNVFALLAQQEMDRPQRELQQMQVLQQKMALKKLMEDQQYNDSMKSYLAAQPQTRDITSLSSIPTPIARDANAPAFDTGEGGLLASLNPMSQQPITEQQPLTIMDHFNRKYDYHMANNREDLAKQVRDDQLKLASEAAATVHNIYKSSGYNPDAVKAILDKSPWLKEIVGDASQMHFDQEGVYHPATDHITGQIIPGEYWTRDAEGKVTTKTVKPEHIPEGVAIPDGKGGYTVPNPKAEKPDAKGQDSIDLGDRVKIIPRDGSKPYYEKKGTSPKGSAAGSFKPPAGYRFTPDGDLEPIPGGPAAAKNGGKVLPAGTLSDIADMNRIKNVMAEAAELLKSKNISTGPAVGRAQSVGAVFGLASDDFVNLQQKLQTAQNIMLKLRSGAAVTESEYARFLKEYPTPNDSPEVRDRKLRNTIEYADTLMNDKMAMYEEGGYKVPQSMKGGESPKKKPSQPAAPQAFDSLPSPKDFTGKVIRDQKTGKRFKSDGRSWRAV